MTQILMGQARDHALDRATMDGMFALRHTVFRERLGWSVESRDGRERDHYDDLDPVYMIVRRDRGGVEGCWRMLPTTGSYMLRDTFPDLLAGEDAPARDDVWELSRFALAPAHPGDRRQAHFGGVTFRMMQEVVDWADRHGVSAYVTVTSVALERMLRHADIPLRRFGDGRSRMIGGVRSVACWIPIDDRTRAAVHGRRDAAVGTAA